MVAREAYFWAWPMVNVYNRRLAFKDRPRLRSGHRFGSGQRPALPVDQHHGQAATNPDGSTDIYFGPTSPGEGRNWLRALPDQGFFVILRLYGPTKAFFDKTWKPGDLESLS